MRSRAPLNERLDRFFGLFEPTIGLAEHLLKAKTNPQEVALLLCARLDALASSITGEDQANRQSFIRLLVNYSGHRNLMESVSAGDLYYELGYHRWLAEGMIPKPGRLHSFSRLNDTVIYLLDRSGVPLTAKDAENLLTRMMRVLAEHFRCRSGQPLKKATHGKLNRIITILEEEFARSRDAELRRNLPEAAQPLLESKTVASLLYGNFRNEAIHGVQVQFDEDAFFNAPRPYWEAFRSEYYPSFLLIKFPARFLIEVLRNCAMTLRQKMLATGKLPPDVHFHAFGPGSDELDFLDEQLLPRGTDLKFKLK